jgi:hypothetical protein
VKVDPRPGSLSTVMSPRQNRRLMARPRPVPPYLLAVAADRASFAWRLPLFDHLIGAQQE